MSYVQNVLWGYGHDGIVEHMYGDYLLMAYRFSYLWEKAQKCLVINDLLDSGDVSGMPYLMWLLIEYCYVNYWSL